MFSRLSKLFKDRRLWAAALLVLTLFVLTPREASACGTYFPCIKNLVANAIFYLTLLLSMLAGVVISIEAWFLQIIFNISFGLVNSAPVKIGFPMVLAIANLFFVGGLIAIAIATIIRREEYGMKKVLWKLVVMAVMVNFGLVICGTLLSVSDETAKFFIQSVSPSSDNPGDVPDYGKFAHSLVGAFNPEASILKPGDVTKDTADAQARLSKLDDEGSNLADLIAPFISALATLGSFVIIIITLGTLILMLLWRYIRLGIALIVLPVAWAAWIFPSYQEHYKKWWTKFTQWTLFPPVVVFFLWLGLKISEVMRDKGGEFSPDRYATTGNPVGDFLGPIITPVVSRLLQTFILFGIMMGGMAAAQELGVKFADAGYKAIEGAGKGARTWAGRRAKQTTGAPRAIRQRLQGQPLAMNTGIGRVLNPIYKGVNAVMGQPRKDADGNVMGLRGAAIAGLSKIEKIQAKVGLAPAKQNKAPEPPADLSRKAGETDEEWQTRVAGMNSKFKRLEETFEQWQARVAVAAQADPQVKRRSNETVEAWQARVAKRNPALKEKKETQEEWEQRVADENKKNMDDYNKADRKYTEEQGKREWNESLLGSMVGSAKAKIGHKKLKPKDVEKALGIHFEHEEGDHGGGHGGGGDHGAGHGGGDHGGGDHGAAAHH